jgi:predicted peptidase
MLPAMTPARARAAAGTTSQSAQNGTPPAERAPSRLKALDFKRRVTRTVGLRYLLSLPEGYGRDEGKRWPLILFLHGAGERGDDLEQVKKHGVPRVVEEGTIKEFPFIAVAPQCPAEKRWASVEGLLALSALLDEVEGGHRVDAERVYLTGLSMGGFGTFALAGYEPERFAAIAPVCGGGDRTAARAIATAGIPTWVFHGAKDETVPLRSSAEMVESMARFGGSPRFTVYPDAKHDSWTETYNNPELYHWLLSHRLTHRLAHGLARSRP